MGRVLRGPYSDAVSENRASFQKEVPHRSIQTSACFSSVCSGVIQVVPARGSRRGMTY